jgi:hypothetical protein
MLLRGNYTFSPFYVVVFDMLILQNRYVGNLVSVNCTAVYNIQNFNTILLHNVFCLLITAPTCFGLSCWPSSGRLLVFVACGELCLCDWLWSACVPDVDVVHISTAFHICDLICNIYKEPTWCNLAVCLLVTAILLYMFRTLSASILRST